KLIGFAIGAFIAGIGGTLLAYKQTNVTFESFAVLAGITVFSTAYMAGITSVSGGITAGVISAGGIFFVLLDRNLDLGAWYEIVSGLGVIFTVIKNPEGIVGPIHHELDKARQKRLAKRAAADGAEGRAPAEVAGAAARPGPALGAALGRTTDRASLSVTSLTVTYGGVTAVDDVTFTVRPGTITGLIGPNGAGKTTTMDAICGFAASRGTVRLDDRDLAGLPPHRRAAAGLGRTFQGLDLYEDLTVEENVVVGQYLLGSQASDEHLVAVLATLDLTAERKRNVAELSQGQRQLVSIARALAGQPAVLLLDEPAAGLDSTESEWLAERLRA